MTSHCCTTNRYSIEELADPAPGGAGDFVESCYLLLNGELPTDEEKKNFNYDITRHSMVPEQLIQFYKVNNCCLSTLTFTGIYNAVAVESKQDASCSSVLHMATVCCFWYRASGTMLRQWR